MNQRCRIDRHEDIPYAGSRTSLSSVWAVAEQETKKSLAIALRLVGNDVTTVVYRVLSDKEEVELGAEQAD